METHELDAPVFTSNLSYLGAIVGYPSISLPAGYTDEGEPVSIEFLGRPFSEPELIAMAFAHENGTQARLAPESIPSIEGDFIPRSFESWIARYPDMIAIERLPLADPDDDGLVNLSGYAHGGNPTDPRDAALRTPKLESLPDSQFAFSFQVPQPELLDVSYAIVSYTGLMESEVIATKLVQNWIGRPAISEESQGGGTMRVTVPVPAATKEMLTRFLSIRYTLR